MSKNNIVLTGSPGVGKTTLLKELKRLGYLCFDEAARKVLNDQLKKDGPALPSKDPKLFITTMLEELKSSYLKSKETRELVFFDRGFGDLYMYCDCFGVNSNFLEDYYQDFSYYKDVFILPIWKEIYVNDDLRKMPFRDSYKMQKVLINTYKKLGYKLIEVPKSSVKERANFILERIT